MNKRNKAEKFIELANKRVNRAIKDMRLVSNLSNKNNYEYTDDQVQKIIRALQRELDAIKTSFQKSANQSDDEFIL